VFGWLRSGEPVMLTAVPGASIASLHPERRNTVAARISHCHSAVLPSAPTTLT
jgi:hypothetical protein